jgi:peptide/nickel transport system substrate-binding protein/oligopeptide transport system substrate-binding protein
VNQTIIFEANAKYWNAANVGISKITWKFNDGEEALKAYNDMRAGTIDGCGLNASALEQAKTDGIFATHGYVSATDATTFCSFYNVNRAIFANESDENACVSTQTPDQAARTNKAMMNQNFRLALSFALDRGAYNAQSVGEELKLTSLRNSYTPGTFVYLDEAVTIKINGVDTTYAAGTYYGKIMQDQLDADQVTIKVWDAEADGGIGSSDGFDGWYNVENAKAELAKAITALAAEGVEITAENPIYIDLPYFAGSTTYTARANVYKQCFDAAFEGKVVLNLVACASQADWLYAGYYTSSGAEANYDIYDLSGWGPDYGDPQTYLDTFLPMYAGYMTKCIGIF